MKDPTLDNDYFNNVITHYSYNLQLNQDIVKRTEITDSKSSLKISYFSLRLIRLIASYSRGDSKFDLLEQFSDTVEVMHQVWDKRMVKMHVGREQIELDVYYLDKYIYMRWMLSLGILLKVPDKEFDILVHFIERDSIKDALYDFLISFKKSKWAISETMNIQKPKNNIKEIIFEPDPEKCQTMIKKYLEKDWLKTYKNFGLDKAHLDIEKGYFYGQWAFEVAAVVKIKGLDDSSFKDNQYYPDRLLH